ncbi:MAG TPA: hypothetical protein VND19_02850 [Acetobacteraceae bacterium]|nr:hypothetical protein [Acetobacteraceae bacterium]
MNTRIIGNQPVAERHPGVVRAWKTGRGEAAARLNFESLDGAWKPFNPKRWTTLRSVAGQRTLAIRESAREHREAWAVRAIGSLAGSAADFIPPTLPDRTRHLVGHHYVVHLGL